MERIPYTIVVPSYTEPGGREFHESQQVATSGLPAGAPTPPTPPLSSPVVVPPPNPWPWVEPSLPGTTPAPRPPSCPPPALMPALTSSPPPALSPTPVTFAPMPQPMPGFAQTVPTAGVAPIPVPGFTQPIRRQGFAQPLVYFASPPMVVSTNTAPLQEKKDQEWPAAHDKEAHPNKEWLREHHQQKWEGESKWHREPRHGDWQQSDWQQSGSDWQQQSGSDWQQQSGSDWQQSEWQQSDVHEDESWTQSKWGSHRWPHEDASERGEQWKWEWRSDTQTDGQEWHSKKRPAEPDFEEWQAKKWRDKAQRSSEHRSTRAWWDDGRSKQQSPAQQKNQSQTASVGPVPQPSALGDEYQNVQVEQDDAGQTNDHTTPEMKASAVRAGLLCGTRIRNRKD